jgi:phosphotransferase system enzyme I (PtsI)
MRVKQGTAVSPGIALGEVILLGRDELRAPRRSVARGEVDAELRRFDRAVAQATREVDEEIQRFDSRVKIPHQVLESHRDMIRDPALRAAVERIVRSEHLSSESALSQVMEGFYRRFEEMESKYISERAQDIREIEQRLLSILLGKRPRDVHHLAHQAVVVAHSLTPGETAAFNREKVLGFAIDVGGRTSHTAILARALQIPAVVGLDNFSDGLTGGETVIVDGYTGLVIVNPDRKTLEQYRSKTVTYQSYHQILVKEIRLPAETVDGYELLIAANIELPEEIHTVVEWGAAGIGLYRTEFLFEGKTLDEEKHYRAYRNAQRLLRDRFLVIRTMDLGADKSFQEGREEEPNPFLGCRSIRLSLEQPEVFKAQVRAVYRISRLGDVRMMLPMISNLDELRTAKSMIRQVKEDLLRRGEDFEPNMKIGIMAEVPSVALMADQFAAEVDFFSIGTNDLVQYALAVDRVNERVGHLYQPANPAVLRLIKMVIEAGHRNRIDVSCCGEMVSEPIYAVLFMGLGLRSFSVSPLAIPTLKRAIRQTTMREAAELAATCLKFDTAQESLEFLGKRLEKLLPKL